MKRFKDCILLCTNGQSPIELLQLVKAECERAGMKAEINTAFAEQDTMGVCVNFEQYPVSKLVLNASDSKNGVAILNIVPLPESQVSMLEIPVYNQILEAFRAKIYQPIADQYGNHIKENTEDYTIQELIPKSFPKLQTWLNMYPQSHHPNDVHRWYDFLIALLSSGEHLGSSVLSEYISENYHWTDKELFDLELRYESQLDLLEYYKEKR